MSEYPIPTAALDDRLGWVGTSGSGKTYNAGTAIERLLKSGARVVIVDPLDVWWGLRLAPDGVKAGLDIAIFGGRNADLPLSEQAGGLIGKTVAGMAESCIVSLGALPSKAAEQRFMLAFLEALYRNTAGDPVHVVFDEADLWAPQNPGKEGGNGPRLAALMEQIVRRGRIKGFIPWLITQRPAVISKDVLSQVDGLVAFKLTSSQDRAAIGAWVKAQADEGQWSAIDSALPSVARGEGVVWLPGHGMLRTAQFPEKATFDSSRSPKRGEKLQRRALKRLNLEALKGRLATIEEDAKANDPAALRAEVARLTRELAKAQRSVAAPPEPVKIVANAEEVATARAEGERIGIALGITRAQQALAGLRIDAPAPGEREAAPAAQPRARQAKVPRASIEADGSVPAGCAKPLAALAGVYPSGMTEAQWATVAGYKRSGGTWGTYKSRLRGAGLIEQKEGRWFATEAGAGAVGDVELPPAPGPELVRWWASRLPGTLKVAEALIEAHPRALSKDELAAQIGMTAAGGSFSTYLSRLASPGIITREGGQIALAAEVMSA